MKNPNETNLVIKVADVKKKDYTMVSFNGDLDKLGLEAVRAQIDEVAEKIETKYLVYDFTDLNFINSESIGYLITIHYRLIKKDKALVIVKASDHVKDVLQVVGITEFIRMYESISAFEESLK